MQPGPEPEASCQKPGIARAKCSHRSWLVWDKSEPKTRPKSFLFSPDYLQFEDKGMFHQFLKDIHSRVFAVSFDYLPMSQRKFPSVFSRSLQSKYYYPSFSSAIRLPSFYKSKNAISFSRSIRKAKSKQEFTSSSFISYLWLYQPAITDKLTAEQTTRCELSGGVGFW